MLRIIKDINVNNKKILLRVGMDVPINENGDITNDKRIIEGLDTIRYLLQKNAKQVITLNHIGRPKNKERELNHDKLTERLSYYLKREIKKLDGCINVRIPEDKVVLLENLLYIKLVPKNYTVSNTSPKAINPAAAPALVTTAKAALATRSFSSSALCQFLIWSIFTLSIRCHICSA